jgi:hypothetical protein
MVSERARICPDSSSIKTESICLEPRLPAKFKRADGVEVTCGIRAFVTVHEHD